MIYQILLGNILYVMILTLLQDLTVPQKSCT